MGRAADLREAARSRARPAEFHSCGRSAVRERRHPSRPRDQQGAQGHRRQVAHARRLSTRRMCRAGTATACRSSTRSRKTRGKEVKTLEPRAFRQACREYAHGAGERPARGLQAPRRDGRLGSSVPDDAAAIRGGAVACVRADPAQRSRLQGPEAGALVSRLPLGAGRSRSRIRGAHLAGDRRAFRRRRTRRILRSASDCRAAPRAGERRDLDDDALDAAGEPGGRARPGDRLRR